MNTHELLQKHGLQPTYGRVSKINDWYARHPGKRATLITVPRNRRMHKGFELIGRVAVPHTDIWITEYNEYYEYARTLLKQYGYVQTQHRIKQIVEWLRVYPDASCELVLVPRDTEVFVIGTIPKLGKDIMIRKAIVVTVNDKR